MKTDIDTIPNLYSITGNILDINTVLINREELRKLVEAKKDLLEVLTACEHWHRGDNWRYSEYKTEQTAWEKQRIAIQTTLFRYKD